jgi:hypothetical protein
MATYRKAHVCGDNLVSIQVVAVWLPCFLGKSIRMRKPTGFLSLKVTWGWEKFMTAWKLTAAFVLHGLFHFLFTGIFKNEEVS